MNAGDEPYLFLGVLLVCAIGFATGPLVLA